jgi:hypothetical protein
MPAPTSYTEAELAAFMHSVLRSVATQLGWSAPGSYTEVVNEVLLAYGVDDIASATNIQQLRLLARREVWRAVVEETAGDYDVRSKDGAEAKRAQINTNARAAYKLAADAYEGYLASVVSTSVAPTSGAASNQAVW